jgi:hypothetical protein
MVDDIRNKKLHIGLFVALTIISIILFIFSLYYLVIKK